MQFEAAGSVKDNTHAMEGVLNQKVDDKIMTAITMTKATHMKLFYNASIYLIGQVTFFPPPGDSYLPRPK